MSVRGGSRPMPSTRDARTRLDCAPNFIAPGRRYIEYPLPPDSIVEIIIGSAVPKDAEGDVARLLDDHGWPGVSVTRSLKAPAAAVPAC
jgi:hypothetical protein